MQNSPFNRNLLITIRLAANGKSEVSHQYLNRRQPNLRTQLHPIAQIQRNRELHRDQFTASSNDELRILAGLQQIHFGLHLIVCLMKTFNAKSMNFFVNLID